MALTLLIHLVKFIPIGHILVSKLLIKIIYFTIELFLKVIYCLKILFKKISQQHKNLHFKKQTKEGKSYMEG